MTPSLKPSLHGTPTTTPDVSSAGQNKDYLKDIPSEHYEVLCRMSGLNWPKDIKVEIDSSNTQNKIYKVYGSDGTSLGYEYSDKDLSVYSTRFKNDDQFTKGVKNRENLISDLENLKSKGALKVRDIDSVRIIDLLRQQYNVPHNAKFNVEEVMEAQNISEYVIGLFQ